MTKWFKNAIIYSLDVDTFYDSNGDGIGDFKGLISKLDYLSGLGITCVWLLPFYPSPNHDNGYDVKDYYNVDKRLGDLGDFVQFMSKCKEVGIKVIIDLVINHTSIEHPWFQMARQDKNSPYRDFYVWSDKPKKFKKDKLMFHNEEHTMWSYDKKAGQYYLHRFYKEQPDLNISCKALQEEIFKIMEFWLHLQVDGFRVDAAEFLIETYGMKPSDKKNLEWFLEEIRSFVQSHNPDAVLLAEANILPQKVSIYMKADKRMHMLFNFFINQHVFLAFVERDARILTKAFEKLPECGPNQQWLNFLRQHDELSLELLSDKQTEKVHEVFAPLKKQRIFRKGIRRRLSPMVNGDPWILRMLYSLLFSLPGAVLMRYGDEIGMGEDLSLQGRSSVRTPMQWSSATNGGFSDTMPGSLVHPVISKGDFSYDKVNVMVQQRDPNSLLNFVERLITTRKQTPEIGSGEYSFVAGLPKEIMVHTCIEKNVTIIFVHNFSEEWYVLPSTELLEKELSFFEIFYDGESLIHEDIMILRSYGFIWLRIENNS